MEGVIELAEGLPVCLEVDSATGLLCIRSENEGGHNAVVSGERSESA
jgi:hypothetical protein